MYAYTHNSGAGILDVRGDAADKDQFVEDYKKSHNALPPTGSTYLEVDGEQKTYIWQGSRQQWNLKCAGEMAVDGGEDGEGGNPVGTIIPYMGTICPNGYLICDGAELGIADFPLLAAQIEANFGAVDKWGGNGTTTFALPDLRNEFLRGYGGKGGLSGEIGVEQEATIHPGLCSGYNAGSNSTMWVVGTTKTTSTSTANAAKNCDTKIDALKKTVIYNNSMSDGAGYGPAEYTSRPVNVAVLFCIKYA